MSSNTTNNKKTGVDTTTTNAAPFLTHQEVSCLKTALALVVIKQRLDAHTPFIQGLNQQEENLLKSTTTTSRTSNDASLYKQHATQIFDLAQNSRHSHYFNSLVTHLVCQLQAWHDSTSKQEQQTSTTTNNDIIQWIQSTLLSAKNIQMVVHVWNGCLSCNNNQLLSTYLIPILLEWFHEQTTTTVCNKNNAGHYWLLLEQAFLQASPETCRQALPALMGIQKKQMMMTVADLVELWSTDHQTLWVQWAAQDLVKRLLTRLSTQ